MRKIPFIALVVLFFVSCEKDDNGTSGCQLNSTSFTGTYRVTAIKYKQTPTSPEQDMYSTIYSSPCETDNVYIFSNTGSYQYSDAGVVCVPPDNFTGTWSLSGNTITIDGSNAQVSDFNCNSGFKLVANNVFTSGDIFTATYVRQ